jgi:hypothetical protein
MGLQYVQLLLALWVCNMCSFCWLSGFAICAASVGSLGLQYVQLLLALWVCNMCSFCRLSGSVQYVQLLLALRVRNMCCFLHGGTVACGSAICAASAGCMGLQYAQLLLTVWVSKYTASVDFMGLKICSFC